MLSQHAGTRTLADADPEVQGLIRLEKKRQLHGIELIASEVPPPTFSFPIER
jgi:glycine/serine hydroxymethyltransferase